MKVLSGCLFLVFASFAYAAVTQDDIVRLSKANTKDDVILQLIQKEGLAKPVTSQDVVYLKEQGVSDRVIQYLIKLSANERAFSSENSMRSYYTTSKTGKQIRVVTNLDENGKRMGGDIPPDPEPPPQEPPPVYERLPQEVHVVVESDPYRDRYVEEYPEYVDDKYSMPQYDSYFPYSTPYFPYYPLIPNHHGKGNRFDGDPNHPNWRFDQSKKFPLVQPRQNHSSPKVIPGSKSKSIRGFKGK